MDLTQLRRELAAVVAIPVAPFAEDGHLDEQAFRRVLARMVDGGVRVLTPNGNTGEYYALSTAERCRVLDLTVELGHDRAVTMAGVGGSVPDAIEAAVHARGAGAEAIMIHQPPHPYVSSAGWVEYHARIAASVPELGVIPYLRNPAISGADVAELARRSPNFVAVKYAVPDATCFARVRQDSGDADLVWIAGLAELSAPGYFAYGATGFTSGLVNVAPRLSLDMHKALSSSDRDAALRLWESIRPFEELRVGANSEHNVSIVKEALAQLSLCRRDVRPPISVLPEALRARVAACLAEWELDAAA
ncbi:dihydrodipicolinate synthase family protein [Pseudonocardia kunmingensis]|uniref:4-hydroxy-tetrahydrodipicolinate synthase n=1 Tax=Pseudonocardia kunmingensis TaxID=630975 RepID=A0A543DK37_9PSEU|nr:dihydrodipicolinate synthase family protein [Pseudonocardia kunmingensis]TQM09698.1 4-hydroxy-tetrahydrodipicolinate synthase [Pseudonocardia kunmingensis]